MRFDDSDSLNCSLLFKRTSIKTYDVQRTSYVDQLTTFLDRTNCDQQWYLVYNLKFLFILKTKYTLIILSNVQSMIIICIYI